MTSQISYTKFLTDPPATLATYAVQRQLRVQSRPDDPMSVRFLPSDLLSSICVIPAAGALPEGVASVSSVSTSAMLPVGGKPVIHWSMEYLTGLGLERFRVGVSKRGLPVEGYVEHVFGGRAQVEWVVCSSELSVGHSVRRLCEGVEGPVLVVLGDTIFRFGDSALPVDRPWVLTSRVADRSQWCVVETDGDDRVVGWFNKEVDAPSAVAAVGVYWFPESSQVSGLVLDPSEKVEISDLLDGVAGEVGVVALPVGEWFDCGHPDTYETSKRSVLAERSFNSLVFDDVIGTVRKSSVNTEKLIDEINYLRMLPNALKPLFPQLIRFSVDVDAPWMEMEYYGYPTLTELFLYHQLHPAVWDRVIVRLAQLLERLRVHVGYVTIADQLDMYVNKTFTRVERAGELPLIGEVVKCANVVVNGQVLEGVQSLRSQIVHAVKNFNGDARAAVIHGDLCFSNILFDIRTGVCRLIDPRGSFGSAGLTGDQRYDIAKLHHSIVGLYDHLVAGLFTLERGAADVFELKIPRTPLQRHVEQAYRLHILSQYSETQVELITGLILVSLPPLHPESSDRQIAFYLKGLEMVNHALGTAVLA